jgi:hypothetical protein
VVATFLVPPAWLPPRVRAVELSRSIVLEQVSIFENCASIPRMPPSSC